MAATVFMPEQAALLKVAATRGYGATVHLVGATIDESLDAAHEFADRTGAVLAPSTTSTSSPARARSGSRSSSSARITTVLVLLGGGGLLGGIAAAVPEGVCRPPAAAWPRSVAEQASRRCVPSPTASRWAGPAM